MTARELAEWEALYLIEPWGERHQEIMFASLLNLLYNANRDPKKSKPTKAKDWVPDWWGERKGQTREQMLAVVKHLCDTMGARHGKHSKPGDSTDA